jgi:HEPN domain-containing protein
MQFAEDEVLFASYVNLYYGLGVLDFAALTPGASVGQRDQIMFQVFFEECVKDMKRIGLRVSASHTEDVIKILEGKNPVTHPSSNLHDQIMVLRSALSVELAQTVFLHVGSAQAEYYREPLNGLTEDVENGFSSTLEDLREASKCFALGRSTASVFHAMRAAEVGLIALGKDLKVPAATNQNWGELLIQIEQAIKRVGEATHGANWRNSRQWYAEASAQLHNFKDAWRNDVMHVHRSYTQSRAQEILTATRAFMCQIATRLSE